MNPPLLSVRPAGDHRQHVLCRLPGDQHGRLQRRQRRAVRGPLPRNLVPDRDRQLGGEMRRAGEVRRLHQAGKLPGLDQRHHAEGGAEPDSELMRL